MATMLAFLTSDVAISSEMLDEVVHEVVNDTFNMVSVDGDTSTNDMLCMLANGLAENEVIQEKGAAYACLLYTSAFIAVMRRRLCDFGPMMRKQSL